MSQTANDYKNEAVRLYFSNPLNVCDRLVKINGARYAFTDFNCDVRIYGTLEWTIKTVFKTTKVLKKPDAEWAHLKNMLLEEYGLKAKLLRTGQTRKYDTFMANRILLGYHFEFEMELTPAEDLNISVLTD